MKKALVTGATGFVGSNLVKRLLKEGWKVDVIVRPSSHLDMLEDVSQSLKIHVYDGDIHALIDIVSLVSPDVVFHIASLFLSDHSSEQVDALIHSNVLFGTQLLEAMTKADVHSLVNTSTSWEHYENKDYSPVNLYAATKRAFQDLLQYYVEAKGMKAITLKLFDTYGSSDPRPKLLNLLMKIAESGETLAMSPGEQEIDLVHIDDVIAAYLLSADRLMKHEVSNHKVYGVGTSNPISLKEIVSLLEKQIGKPIHIEWGGREYRNREVMNSFTPHENILSPEEMTGLQTGIKDVVKVFKS